jgi:uncharacterized repeat protein (TIGR02543 family)
MDTNPLDPNAKSYVPPSFTIKSESENLGDGDTIHRTWAKLVLEGNRKECRFQIQINDGDTSSWQSSNEFILKPLTDGTHNVLIKCKYNGGSDIVSKRINFTAAAEGFVPKFFSVIKPDVKADSLETLILSVQVSGVAPITFTWYKNGAVISGQTQNVLEIKRFTKEDVGEYYCVAANEYDSIKGPLFRVQLRSLYTITYNGNENTSGEVPFDANSYSAGDIGTVKGNVNNLEKTGFSFVGWSTQKDGDGAIYSSGAEILIGTADVVLWAKWVKTMTFAVRYIKNGATSGDVPIDDNLYDPGTIIVVKSNIQNLQKKNFTFVGWNTASDGNGKDYAPGVQLTIQNDHVILYAKWTQRTVCTIKYDGNGNTGGTVPVDSNVYELGSTILTRDISETFVKDGFKFAGWNTRADGNGTSYGRDVEFEAQDTLIILYARWTDKETFTITYDGNGNTSGEVPVDINNYEKEKSAVLKKNVGRLAKTGYRFVGWCADKDGNGTRYAPEDTVQILGNTVMYAVWGQIITYKITYDGNNNTGGMVPYDSVAHVAGNDVIVLSNSGALTRTDYVFAGWNTSPDGKGTQLYPGNSFTIDSTVTLYARWTKETTYTVSYDVNGSTSGAAPVDNNHYVSGDFAIAASNSGNLSRSKYSFAGWNTKPDGSGTSYKAGELFSVISNITLYANWTLSKTYSITYNGNLNTSGTVPVDPNAYIAGNIAVVMGNTGNLTREGYTFTGWNENADGSGTPHTPNSDLKLESQNVTLYAVWTKITVATFSVTYYGNANTGGNVPIDNSPYIAGSQATILSNSGALTKLSFTFAGWGRTPSPALDSILMPRDIIIMNDNVKLYAVWTNKTLYRVVYNANGSNSGSEPKDDNLYLPGMNVTVKGNTGNLIKNGNTFVGWNTKRDGSGITYTENMKMVKNGYDDTLFAKWSANPTYTITYMSNNATSGTVPVDANTYEAGVTVMLKTNSGNLARNGYTFKGWNTKSDGTGIAFTAGASVTMPSFNSILYADWQLIPTYSVTYNGNYYTTGSLPVDPVRYASNATVVVKGNTGGLTKTGMTFSGWNTQINGTGNQYNAGATFQMGSSDVVLYAMWTNNPTYTVSYNANGANSGNVPIDAGNYKQGDIVTVMYNVGGLARSGYTFDGWNTNSGGTGTQYASNAQFAMGTSNVSLWAKWKPVAYVVTFDDQSATTRVNPTTITVTYPDTSIKNYPAAPVKTGNIFGNWYTSTNGGGVRFTNTTKVTANITVFANWTPYYNLSYLGNGNTGGSSPVDTVKYTRGQSARILGVNTLRKDGYTFANWNSMYNAKGKFYAQNDTLIIGSSAVTLHAAWRATIAFDGQGATTGPSPATISIFHPDTLLPSMPTDPSRTGYTFAGWYTAVSGGTQFTATTKVSGNDTLYARWTINKFTLAYDGNGSDGGTAPAGGTYDYNTVVKAAPNTFTRSGYTFTGWNTAANGSGTAYAVDANVTMTATTTLFAQWSVIQTYSIVYNANGGTGSVPVNAKTYLTGDSIHVAGNTGSLTKIDSVFAGWSRVAGSGTVYKSGDTLMVGSSNITLYARWIKMDALAITAFSFSSPSATGVIDNTAKTVIINVPFGTAVTSLTPTITHSGVSISPASGVPVDFTNDVAYTITGADASTEMYTVSVNVAANPAKSITAFNFTAPAATGLINNTLHTIAVTVPYGTNVTSLSPTITHSGTSLSPLSGVAQNFTNPVTYTVTAADGTTQDYTVTVNVAANPAKSITAFNFTTPAVTGVINSTAHTITLNVPYGTDVTGLIPTITHTGASVNPESGVPHNFTNAVTYTVTAADGTTQDYTVTVNVAANPAKSITAFNFTTPAVTGVIDNTAHTITVNVPYGTDITSLIPTITHTGASVSPESGVLHNFTNAVTYTVTAADGTTQDYTVTVNVAANPAKSITSFNFTTPAVTGVIDNTAHTITVDVPYGTGVTNLTPTITHTGASISPASGVVQDFTSQLSYTVTAADGTTQVYTVTVNVASNP